VCHAMALGGFGVWGAKRGVSLFARPSSTTLLHMQAAASMEDSGLWADNDATFAGLGLRTELVEALTQLGFARPTRIQAATLPALLAGKDVVMGAETGSGKTLAYALPMLQKVLVDRDAWDKCPEVLVLVPNQELARQVTAVIQRITTLKDELNVPVTMLAGSAGLSQSAACAVLVATPSAILRNTNPSYLDQVHTAIVDEADMLLDGGFVADVTRILDFLCPRVSNSAVRRFAREGKTAEDAQAALEREPAQVVFAAATLPDWKGDKVKSVVRVLRKRFPEAEHIATKQLHKQSRAASHDWVDLGQGTSKDDVRAALLGVLQGERRGLRTLVFCNSVTDCKETHQFLTEAGYSGALVLHKEVPPCICGGGARLRVSINAQPHTTSLVQPSLPLSPFPSPAPPSSPPSSPSPSISPSPVTPPVCTPTNPHLIYQPTPHPLHASAHRSLCALHFHAAGSARRPRCCAHQALLPAVRRHRCTELWRVGARVHRYCGPRHRYPRGQARRAAPVRPKRRDAPAPRRPHRARRRLWGSRDQLC
jgi:hypothetical protein